MPDQQTPSLGVGAVIVDGGRLLMVRRAKDPGRGLWSVPGGHVERGEYLGDAVRREVREETGLDIEVEGLIGFFEVLGDEYHYVILDFMAHPVAGDLGAGTDVDEVEWVPLDQVTRRECTPRFVELLTAWGVLPKP
jgi:ADP-ribose pyrophosphatase YjhB (NUDIX family)